LRARGEKTREKELGTRNKGGKKKEQGTREQGILGHGNLH
jgi:hypothetical protein